MKVYLVNLGFGESSFNTFGDSHWSSVIHYGLCSISAYAKSKDFSAIKLISNLEEITKIFLAMPSKER